MGKKWEVLRPREKHEENYQALAGGKRYREVEEVREKEG